MQLLFNIGKDGVMILIQEEIKERFNIYIKNQDIKGCVELYSKLSESDKADKDITAFSVILQIAEMENNHSELGIFTRADCKDLDSMIQLYSYVKHAIRRVEFEVDNKVSEEFLKLKITKSMLLMMVSLFSYDRKKVASILEKCYRDNKDIEMAKVLHSLAN